MATRDVWEQRVERWRKSGWLRGNGSIGLFSPTELSKQAAPQLITTASAVFGGSSAETLCLEQADQQLQCWGAYDKGQTGTGIAGPTVGTPTRIPLVTVTSAAFGQDNVCALTQDNELWCWGDNKRGQLANGTLVSASSPVRVDFPCP